MLRVQRMKHEGVQRLCGGPSWGSVFIQEAGSSKGQLGEELSVLGVGVGSSLHLWLRFGL